jgi:hypothetical protein
MGILNTHYNNTTEREGGEGIIPKKRIDVFTPTGKPRKRTGGGVPRAKGTRPKPSG